MLGFYNYTVILTYMGMLSGFLGIAAVGDGNLQKAMLCLIFSGICDMFDGKVASTMERTVSEKQFGIQIDSLSDLICFGVLPAMIVHRICHFGVWLGALYVLCALIRLAWFNVDEQQRQEGTTERRTAYLGLPVTTAAAIFPLSVVFANGIHQPMERVMPVAMAVTAICFLTPFRLPKPKLTKKLALLVCGCAVLVLLLVRL